MQVPGQSSFDSDAWAVRPVRPARVVEPARLHSECRTWYGEQFFKPVGPEVDAALAQPQQQQGQDPAIQMMMAQAKADIEIKRQKAMADIQLAREKALAELELKRMEFEAEAQMKAMKVGAGITGNVEIPG